MPNYTEITLWFSKGVSLKGHIERVGEYQDDILKDDSP